MRIFIFFMPLFLFGANLINVNFFNSNNKIDILLSLDDKFNGKVIKLGKNSYEITNIKSEKVIQKEFSNSFINSIIIAPQKDNSVKLDIISNDDLKIGVALTPDGYGLRIRLAPNRVIQKELVLPQKESSNFNMIAYLIVLFVLFLIALFLLWFRKKKGGLIVSDMKILFQRPLDSKNRVALLEFKDKKYLVIIGNSNLLLDKFDENFTTPKNEVEFDEMLRLSSKFDNIEEYIKKAEKLDKKIEKVEDERV